MKNWNHKWLFSLMLLSALTGCSVMTPHLVATKVSLPPQPIVRDSFSLLPLNEDGWMEMQEGYTLQTPLLSLLSKGDTLALVAKGKVIDETRIITVYTRYVQPMTASMTDENFVTFAKSVKKIEDPKRLELLKQEVRPDNSTGKDCMNVHTTLKDLAPQTVVKNIVITHRPMIIDSLYWVCKHPDGKQMVIVEYSDRFYPGDEEADFDKKAETIFHGLQFVTH